MKHRRTAAFGIAALCIVSACSGDDDSAPETTVPATTTTLVSPRDEDGELRIGILLPPSDSLLGAPLLAAVETAVDGINLAGGILGRSITTEVADEGTGAAAIGVLIDADVDAVIGPASSLVALSGLSELVSAGVMTCSPTATALALDDFPDANLFYRTIPSDSMQADLIAGEAENTGRPTAVITHIDDSYGRDYAAAVESAIDTRAIEVIDVVPFVGHDDDFSDEAQRVAESGAEIVIVLGTGADSARFLVSLDQQEALPPNIRVIVNGDIRTPDAQPLIESLSSEFRSRLVGVGPQAVAAPDAEPWVPAGPYATNAHDCVNLVALSSMLAGSTIGVDMAAETTQVAANGRVCTTFIECKTSFDDDLNFNYVGPSGVLELNTAGELVRANFIRFVYDEAGRDVVQASFLHPA